MNMSDESSKKTLYVGNLSPAVTDRLLLSLFGQLGEIKSLKLISEGVADPYCFIEYVDILAAQRVLATMNQRMLLNKEMKVNWASSPSQHAKVDTSNHFHVFVGDLSPEIETQQLREAFMPFGDISDCRVVRDSQTQKSKGYGFVSFINKMEAENAITAMNGQYLGSRNIRTNWAARKPPAPKSESYSSKPLSYEEVFNQSSPTNCTVYCGGVGSGLCDELMQKTFSQFGIIEEIRVFKDKGYAFIRFANKESATSAIIGMHNVEVAGQSVKCSWGKESGDPNNVQSAAAAAAANPAGLAGFGAMAPGAQYPAYGGYGAHQMGYWYPPQGYQPAAAAAAAAAAHMQGMQGYGVQGYGIQYGYQQGGMSRDYHDAHGGH